MSSKLQYSRKQYTENDIHSYAKAHHRIRFTPRSSFKQSIHFDSEGVPISKDKGSSSFSINYNKTQDEVRIVSYQKDPEFWYEIEEHMSITAGDFVRAGKAVLNVHDIYLISQHNKIDEQEESEKDGEKHCRICERNKYTLENPLLKICQCEGVQQFVHLQCYRKQYHRKIKFLNEPKITYFELRNIRCETCETLIPFSVKADGREYTILNYKKDFNKSLPNIQNEIKLKKHIQELAKYHEEGVYIIFKVDHSNEGSQGITEVIQIKLKPEKMVTFGNQKGAANIIIGNGNTSPLHMSIVCIENNVFVFNHCKDLGTFIRMKKGIAFEFIGKRGVTIDCENKQLLLIAQKQWLLQCFQGQKKFRISLVHKPKEYESKQQL